MILEDQKILRPAGTRFLILSWSGTLLSSIAADQLQTALRVSPEALTYAQWTLVG